MVYLAFKTNYKGTLKLPNSKFLAIPHAERSVVFEKTINTRLKPIKDKSVKIKNKKYIRIQTIYIELVFFY